MKGDDIGESINNKSKAADVVQEVYEGNKKKQ